MPARTTRPDTRRIDRLVRLARRIKTRSSDCTARAAWLAAAAVVSQKLDVPLIALLSNKPRHGQGDLVRRVAHARRMAIYLAVTRSGIRQARIAKAARMHRQQVHHACHRIEDMRDDANIDLAIAALEDQFAGVRS